VIPKGWPLVGQSAQASAAQEAHEEAGVEGDVDSQSIGTYPYLKRLKDGEVRPLSVEVFALRVTRELSVWPEQGQRQRRWFSLKDAAGSVDEPELADIIRAFAPAL
jgi:8-oxo-dGTP pyrophosphatase MutT (NUDIX family)